MADRTDRCLGPVHANNGLALPPTKGEGKEWDAANTLRIRKEHDAALALCGWQPVNLFLKVGEHPFPAVWRRRASLAWSGQAARHTPCLPTGKGCSQAHY